MLKARGEVQKQAASPDQGKNSPAGGTDSGAKNDMRSDAIESMRNDVVLADNLSELTSVVRELYAEVIILKGK